MDLKFAWDGGTMTASWLEATQDDGLQTAVLISLLSDARAGADDDLPVRETNRRGWWAGAMEGAYPWGCKWWLRWRDKQLPETAAMIADDAREALAWMTADGLATAIEIDAQWLRRGVLGIEIIIRLPSGRATTLNMEIT